MGSAATSLLVFRFGNNAWLSDVWRLLQFWSSIGPGNPNRYDRSLNLCSLPHPSMWTWVCSHVLGFTLDPVSRLGTSPLFDFHLSTFYLITLLPDKNHHLAPFWSPFLGERDLSLALDLRTCDFGLWLLFCPHYRIPQHFLFFLTPSRHCSTCFPLQDVCGYEPSAFYGAVLITTKDQDSEIWGSSSIFSRCDLAKIFKFSKSECVSL